MDDAPLTGVDERKVRAARRFGLIGLLITIGWLLFVPATVLFTGAPPAAYGWPLAVLYLAGLGLHLWRIRQHVTSLGSPASVPFMVAAAVVALAIALVGIASTWTGWIWALVSGVLLGDIVSGRRARWAAVAVVAGTGLVFGAGVLVSSNRDFGFPIAAWVGPLLAAVYVASMWAVDVERLWWLKAVTDLDESRRAAAELATARERLRLADDLHDILGHALEVVAFKSELASRLLDTEPARARTEMDEVQQVARQSLQEVRAMVRDTRSTDLATELAGARAVLDSAGVELVVRGDPATVAGPARSVLGRVLREAMTNVLRHAQPRHCTIEIEVVDGATRLRVVNDGAPAADVTTGPGDDTTGTGLLSLSRYLDEHAGHLDAAPGPDGTFRLDATLPATASPVAR